jgi:uncharacterized protein (TIGR03083 family)
MTVVQPDAHPIRTIVGAISERSVSIGDALSDLSTEALLEPSLLPGWTRLTVACHLRYGAEALLRITQAAGTGEPSASYPQGRAVQRAATLEPHPSEDPQEVIASLCVLNRELDEMWDVLDAPTWHRVIVEPEDNPDLGTIPLLGFPMLRLTEVEVHGSDLDLGLDDWSEVFVTAALPARVHRLSIRRTNHRTFDRSLQGSWLLVAVDGPSFIVVVSGDEVTSSLAAPDSQATAVIEATSRDLLALLLGRPLVQTPDIRGDFDLAQAFQAAFPGP